MTLTLKGKEMYRALVQSNECTCKLCNCKYQHSCIGCKCCLRDHFDKASNNFTGISNSINQVVEIE